MALLGSRLRAPQPIVKVSAGLHSHPELNWGRINLQAHSDCW